MKIHFIGIGGIGVSALAQYYLAQGHQVSGSDLVASEITELLKEKGAKVFIGQHKATNVSRGVNRVIYSPAVGSNNPELKRAKKFQVSSFKFQVSSYPEALGELTKKHFTIAICGTHGKSTTAAMISLILIKAGLDPTVIIGTKLKEFGNSNFRLGGFPSSKFQSPSSKILVIEADEWQASFLNYWPKVIVLTNIEREHLDYYKNLVHIRRTYQQFISHLPKDGVLVVNKDDPEAYRISFRFQVSPKQSKLATGQAGFRFQVCHYSLKQKESKEIKEILKIPGEHNVSNALAAFVATRYGIRYAKVPEKTIYQTLSEYKGSWRRFEIKRFQVSGFLLQVIHDYAHHPTEISATLQAAREKWPKKPVWLIFQPHQYQRTYYLFNDFVKIFRQAPVDRVIMTDIYDVAGRENKQIRAKISSEKLVEAIKKNDVIYLKRAKILPYLRENFSRKQLPIIIVMGAGDIYTLFTGY